MDIEGYIDNTYKLKEQIGKGSFGEIYIGIHKYTKEKVAIKIERVKEYKTLFHEAVVYNEFKKEIGFPKLLKLGKTDSFNYIIIDLLGRSLEDLKEECGGTLSLKTVVLIAIQVIERLELMHTRGFMHRDIKPDNFLIGRKQHKDIIYIIDFGLTKRYRSKYTHRHNKFVSDKNLVGTPRYASVSVMSGFESSRRDDLESVGYMLIYLLKGKLPWQGFSAKTKNQKYKKIHACKNKIGINELCENIENIIIPKIFYDYLEYCKKLAYIECPNYEYLKDLFRNYLKNRFDDILFDWDNQSDNIFDNKEILREL